MQIKVQPGANAPHLELRSIELLWKLKLPPLNHSNYLKGTSSSNKYTT